jgi:hypothetical protein
MVAFAGPAMVLGLISQKATSGSRKIQPESGRRFCVSIAQVPDTPSPRPYPLPDPAKLN